MTGTPRTSARSAHVVELRSRGCCDAPGVTADVRHLSSPVPAVVAAIVTTAILFLWSHHLQHLATNGLWRTPTLFGLLPEILADDIAVASLTILGGTLVGLAVLLCVFLSRLAKQRADTAAVQRRLLGELSFTETLLDSLPTPVFIKHVDGRYLDCNPAFEELVGFRRAEIVGRRVEDVFPAGQAAGARRHDEEIMASQQRQTYEADVVWRDGSVRRWLVFKSPFKGDDGGAGGLIGVILDITERKRAEEALQRSQTFFHKVLNTVAQPVFVKNREHRLVFVNDATCAAWGYAREDLLTKGDEDFFPAEQVRVFHEKDDLVFASRVPNLNEERITDARGNEHVVLTKKAVFADESGEDVLVGVITDITERKKAEEAMQLAAEVFEHSAEGILVADDQARILSVNRAFTEITGYAEEEVLGLNPRILASGTHDRSFYSNIFRTVAKAGFWKGEIVNRRKSGELYVIETAICAVRDSTNAIRRYIAIMRDITERKNNEERLCFLAQHDFLTGLANRALLNDRIDVAILRSRRSRRKLAVILLDLNRFKAVNDRYGHAVGDALLKEAANRLLGTIRQTDTVCRLGGDEFVVVLPDLRGRADAEKVCRKIAEEIARPFDLGGIHVEVGVSIGIAISPDDGDDRETLLQIADQAMYREKHDRHGAQRLIA